MSKGGKYLTPEDREAMEREQAERARRKSRKSTAVDAQWEPAPGRRSDVQRLADAVKGAMPYVAAAGFLLYWEVTGQIDCETAMPAVAACALAMGCVFGGNLAGK